ncbi:MAG: alpha-2-macroglobulin family protein, partial [Saprospiraceae bacterium]|nr:alpha-2-macroglobulin family protein [Saprospiraceae bacterium]
TVFFFPDMHTTADGTVTLRFRMKESLTRWKFMALAHTQDLAIGLSEKEIVTQKELMIFPHVPRFMREKDTLWLSAKVHNMTGKLVEGTAELQLDDPLSNRPLDDAFRLDRPVQEVSIPAGSPVSVRWQVAVPTGQTAPVRYRMIVSDGSRGDGEEGVVPVLTSRIFVTESIAMHIPAESTRTFEFESLQTSVSNTLRSHNYTVEMTSNPAWYAVQALPYLQEFPHACVEQQFNRLYANLLGGHIIDQFPAIKQVFEQWSQEEAGPLQSNLSRNQELKSVLLEETPWVRTSMSEEEQHRNMALLFDLHKLRQEAARTLQVLQQMQLSNGGFPWFSGGRDNWYMTQYIVESAGHLQQLGAVDPEIRDSLNRIIGKAIRYLDARVVETYQELTERVKAGKAKWKDDNLTGLL